MAHAKSAQKRIGTNEKRRLRNQAVKSRVKTTIKKYEGALTAEALAAAYKEIDKAVSKGIIHKNTANRKKSRLAVKLNTVSA